MSIRPSSEPFVLGIDLGVASIGWALLRLEGGSPASLLDLGAHCFDAAVEGDVASGRDESRAKARRDARLPRRQHWRRARRRQKLLRLLQRYGMLPPGDLATPQDQHQYLLALDADVRSQLAQAGIRADPHLMPYQLRTLALDTQLPLHWVGRAIYHLAQRRGFLSNRKADPHDDELGKVRAGIGELAEAIEASGSRTLGEYFAQLDPLEERVRHRWTGRQMYLDEFDAIWSHQASHHAVLTDDVQDQIRRAVFFQRPLRSQAHLIGECSLIPGARRAPWAARVAQRFRILQKLNDLQVILPDNNTRRLTSDERQQVLEALEHHAEVKFTSLRSKKHLGLPRGSTFNLEEGGETRLVGHRTDHTLRKAFGDHWDSLPEDRREEIVTEILSFEKPEALAGRARSAWSLDTESAERLAHECHLEPGHAAHSRKALAQLVEAMEDGTSYTTARDNLFPDRGSSGEPVDHLPPVLDAIADLRNPAVCRALTELRKLVNALIRRYGKPTLIRLELATELKRSRKQRQEVWKRNRSRQSERQTAASAILDNAGIHDPSARDIDKVLLAEECGWICPYTGKQISWRTLLGKAPQFDIEHIWPMTRSLDNTFFNKTLCHHEENRARKRNATPFEAYSADAERFGAIIDRVRRFKGPAAREKLRRFQADAIPDGFANRHLQDTRYASRLATDYLGLLYGGRIDADHTLRVQVSGGGLTHHLRNEWSLNAVLGDGDAKSRDDHRHHAVDAIVIALSSPAAVKRLADAAQRAPEEGRRLFASVPNPWPAFFDEVCRAVGTIHVSHRPEHKLNGPLHAETIYSKPIPQPEGEPVHHVRKELHKLTDKEIAGEQIVDPVVRKLVQDRYAQLGGGSPAKVFADPVNHPALRMRSGQLVPIHKVRLRTGERPRPVARGTRQRYVASKPGSNHHIAIVAELDAQGRDRKWTGHLVSRFEAMRRHAAAEPVVRRQWASNQVFRFSLAPGDYVLMTVDEGPEQLYRVTGISEKDIEFRLHTDARTMDDIKKAKQRVRGGPDRLRKRSARKVHVTYLGEIRPAHD